MEIEKQWLQYCDEVIPANAGPIQIASMENSFYGGALIMFMMLTEALPNDEDAAYQVMINLRKELAAYFQKATGQVPKH